MRDRRAVRPQTEAWHLPWHPQPSKFQAQGGAVGLQAQFKGLAETLTRNEEKIVVELVAVQGKPADIGGYYLPETEKCQSVMRPSATLNAALAQMEDPLGTERSRSAA